MQATRQPHRPAFATVLSVVGVALLTLGCSNDPSTAASDGGTPAVTPTQATSPTRAPARTHGSPPTTQPGSGSGPTSPASRPAPGASCLRPRDGAELVHFGPRDGLGGFVLGTGRRYVVLAHQSLGESCQMLPLARLLAAAGYRAFAFDSAGTASSAPGPLEGHQVSDDVLAAVAWSRAQRATSVALIGASKGGYGVLDAALQAKPPVDAVVSLSAPDAWDDPTGRLLDLSAMATSTQLWAARQDAGFVDAAREFAGEDRAAELHVVPGAGHGVELVPAAFRQIRSFLDAHLR